MQNTYNSTWHKVILHVFCLSGCRRCWVSRVSNKLSERWKPIWESSYANPTITRLLECPVWLRAREFAPFISNSLWMLPLEVMQLKWPLPTIVGRIRTQSSCNTLQHQIPLRSHFASSNPFNYHTRPYFLTLWEQFTRLLPSIISTALISSHIMKQ